MQRYTIAMVLCTLVAPAVASEPFLEKSDLFEAGKDGYALYRIPGIIVTRKGTILAYCEARKNAGGDWGHIDIVMRRSTDGGKTWLPRQNLVKLEGKFERNPAAVKQKLGKEGEITLNNPVAITDIKTDTVHFLFCVEYNRCFYMRSDDEGATFTKPVEITATFDKFRPEYDWKVLATGPGHGIHLAQDRLLVPVWLSTGTGGHAHRPSCVAVIYSDDRGKTWKRGDIVVRDPDIANPSETVTVQLKDGRVMLNIRNEAKDRFRAVSISPNGATEWSKPTFDRGLPEPVCMGSILHLGMFSVEEPSRVIFANPNNPTTRERKNLSVRLSYDEAGSWPTVKAIEPGPSGYCDLAVAHFKHQRDILCFYERGVAEKNAFRPRWLTVARFNLEWLTDGKDALWPNKK